jgi:hypothetical protein|tara:strand:+ start:2417 stop:2608 length:192 start_codon:yes stop_codon:yes gene_type:complete
MAAKTLRERIIDSVRYAGSIRDEEGFHDRYTVRWNGRFYVDNDTCDIVDRVMRDEAIEAGRTE